MDTGCCLIYQKLQLLNICIRKRKAAKVTVTVTGIVTATVIVPANIRRQPPTTPQDAGREHIVEEEFDLTMLQEAGTGERQC